MARLVYRCKHWKNRKLRPNNLTFGSCSCIMQILSHRIYFLFMPNKQNARKALRQAKKRTVQNLSVKKAYKAAVKATVVATKAEVAEKMRLAQKKLDKAAKKGVLKKNAAARKLSRLTKKVKKVVA